MEELNKISCEACKKEIPESVVVTAEGAEYVLHFCCPDCRDHYFLENPDKKPKG